MTGNTGSFGGSREQVEQAIAQKRASENLQQNVEQQAEAAEQKEKERVEEEVNSKLPRIVDSGILGRTTFEKFKEMYKSVWDQVADKSHFLSRRVTFTTEIPMHITVQSLTQAEQRCLELWAPNKSMTQTEIQEASMDYSVLRLVIQLRSVEEIEFVDVPLSVLNREDWRKDPAIVQQIEVVSGWDPQFVTFLVELVNDLDAAKYTALVENLKHP